MGLKTTYLAAVLVLISQLFLLLGIFLPFHKVSFFTFWIPRVARMDTYPLWINFPPGKNDFKTFCEYTPLGDSRWCRRLEGPNHDIQDLSHRMCSSAMRYIWPRFCSGLTGAHLNGMGVACAVAVNMFLMVTAIYVIFHYTTRKANPQYRVVASTCGFVGALFVVCVLVLYYIFVIMELDAITIGGLGGMAKVVLEASHSVGVSEGYIICWLGVSAQLTALILFNFARSEFDEWVYEENKANEEFRREEMLYGGMDYAQTSPSFQPQPIMQPPMMPGPMMQPPVMVIQQQPVGYFVGPTQPMAMGGGTGGDFGLPPAGMQQY